MLERTELRKVESVREDRVEKGRVNREKKKRIDRAMHKDRKRIERDIEIER